MKTRRNLILGSLVAAAFAASTAYADPQGPGGPRGDTGDGPHHSMMRHGHGGFTNPMARVEGRLAAIKVELKITAGQESAWKTFADRSRKQAETMHARFEKMKGQTATELSAPEQLARRTEFAKQHLATMESMTVAVKDLYSVLDPEQKKTADRLLAEGPRGGFGGGRGGHREHGGHGMRS